jgi:flagellar M-ring protein FliF
MNQLTKMGPIAAMIRLWNELTPAQRAVVMTFAAVSVVAVIMISIYVSKPKMSVLFSNLEQEDAGAIVQKLDDEKTPYELSQDGTTIMVPDNKVLDLRIKMATAGLPQGGSAGYELFDKQQFGMTEFTEKVTFQRAMQGELTRTIMQLSPVMNAKVLIVVPQDKIFSSEQEPPTASVVLKLKRGMPLSDDQIGAIVHLVSGAVEGLKPENVTLLDTSGNLLNEGKLNSSGGNLTTNQSKLKKQYETNLASNLQSMLARMVGANNAIVRVSADMDFDSKQTSTESYEPASGNANAQKGVAIKEDTTTETYAGSVIPPSGMPISSNSRLTGAKGDNYSKKTTSAEFQVTRKTEQIVTAPGTIKRISVSVIVNDTVESIDDKGKTTRVPLKVPIAKIQEAVKVAAGLDTTSRGDQITVQSVPFDDSQVKAVEKEMASAGKMDMYMNIGKNVGGALLLIIFLISLSKIVKSIKLKEGVGGSAQAGEMSAFSGPMPTPAELIQRATEQQYSAESTAAALEEQFATAPPIDQMPAEVTQASPEDLARLVRQWMNDEQ